MRKVMKLTDQQILNFIARIKLSQEKKANYTGQIDGVKDNVRRAINGMQNTRVTKVKRAGSWKKGTALRPWGDNPLDVDMVFFIDVGEKTNFDAEELRAEIIEVLRNAYPNKAAEDFTDGRKTVGIVFRGTGLEIDIVPFIPDRENSSYGRQPRKKLHAGEFRTSVDKQLQFISDVRQKWSSFTSVVRMIKWWRNQEELGLPSFAVELLFARLFIDGVVGDKGGYGIESAIIGFFEFVSANPDMRVQFPRAVGVLPSENPVVADPTNNANNVLANLSGSEWHEIVQKANTAFETVSYARAVSGNEKTANLWREVFREFNIQ